MDLALRSQFPDLPEILLWKTELMFSGVRFTDALARAVDDADLSERILAVCRQAVERVAAPGNEPPRNPEAPAHAAC